MKELNSPGIKLFGKRIALAGIGNIPAIAGRDPGIIALHQVDSSNHASGTCLEDDRMNEFEEKGGQEAEKDHVDGQTEPRPQEKGHQAPHPITEESKASPELNESPKTPSVDEETATKKPPKAENDQSDTTNSQQKTLKKPDKVLPCPRCNSKDTKFCYYNNYNVNQPRYFCKSCQRYWTSGGAMRNVPVGAGRRKNKNSDSHCRHTTISEALCAARIDGPNGIHQNNGTALSFGSVSPLCKSMPCVLNLAEKKVPNTTQNGFYKLEQGVPVSCKGGGYGDDCSGASSITTSVSNMEGTQIGVNEPKVLNGHAFPSQVPFLPGVPLPCPWKSAVPVPVPTIFPSGFPLPYYPTPYWNCNVPGSWSIPCFSPLSHVTNQKAPGYGPKSPILGKHSREGDLLKPSNVQEREPFEKTHSERSVLVPKTLRMKDLDEAAKSTIWATLGIKNDSTSNECLFKAFQSKKDEKSCAIKPSPVLQANPAALSRSLSFHERA